MTKILSYNLWNKGGWLNTRDSNLGLVVNSWRRCDFVQLMFKCFLRNCMKIQHNFVKVTSHHHLSKMKSKFAIPCVGKWRRKKILEINILFLLIKNKFKPHFANVKNCLDSTNTLHFLDNALYQPIWRKECVYYHFKYHCISNFEKYIDLVCGEQKVAYL